MFHWKSSSAAAPWSWPFPLHSTCNSLSQSKWRSTPIFALCRQWRLPLAIHRVGGRTRLAMTKNWRQCRVGNNRVNWSRTGRHSSGPWCVAGEGARQVNRSAVQFGLIKLTLLIVNWIKQSSCKPTLSSDNSRVNAVRMHVNHDARVSRFNGYICYNYIRHIVLPS